MRKRVLLAAGFAIALASAVVPAGASAATEIGSNCQANSGAANYTFVQLKRVSGGSLPIAAPSAGVVTKWKVNSGVPTAVGQKLQILRPTGNPNEFQTVAESAPATVILGQNSFDTRLPIKAGDRPAAAGAPGGSVAAPLYCSTANPEDEMGALTPESTLGSTNTYPPATGYVAAISAVIEPDVDGDGYGDETQDACPQSAAVQVACPVVALSTSASATRKAVTLLVTSTTPASVTVNGKVSLGKGKKANLKGGVKAVNPGTFTKFRLKFPAKLLKRLQELPPSKKLTLKVTSSAPNIAAAPTKKVLKVKLKGQAKG